MAYNYDEESVNALMKWAENALLPKEVTLVRQNISLTPLCMLMRISAILSSIIRMLSIIWPLIDYIG